MVEGDYITGTLREAKSSFRYHETLYGTTDQAAPATNTTMGTMIRGRKRATRTNADGERMAGRMVEERER